MNFNDITASLKLQPTNVKRKGQSITSKHQMKDDIWSYEVGFVSNELEKALEALLKDLLPSNEYIRDLATKYEVYIFFSLRSNLGQMGFELKSDVLKALSNLNIRFEVHILSYGEVEDT